MGASTYADEHALALDVYVGDGELVRERHCGVVSRVLWWRGRLIGISIDGRARFCRAGLAQIWFPGGLTGTRKPLMSKAAKLVQAQGLFVEWVDVIRGARGRMVGQASAHLHAKQLLFVSLSECRNKQLLDMKHLHYSIKSTWPCHMATLCVI